MLALNDESLIVECENSQCNECYKQQGIFSTKYECINPEPNIFWIGQILHCVQDSYSKSHTLRVILKGSTVKTEKELKSKENDYVKKDNVEKYEFIKLLKSSLPELPESNSFSNLLSDVDILNFLNKQPLLQKYLDIIKRNPIDVTNMFKLQLFFKNQKNKIRSLYDNDKGKLPSFQILNKGELKLIDDYPYIKSFRFIGYQSKCSTTVHYRYDNLEKNKEFERHIIENCKNILTLYKNHIKDDSKTIKQKINEFVEYVSIYVFAIPKQYYTLPSDSTKQCDLDIFGGKNNKYNINKYKNYLSKYNIERLKIIAINKKIRFTHKVNKKSLINSLVKYKYAH
jgi:hypothetical protein